MPRLLERAAESLDRQEDLVASVQQRVERSREALDRTRALHEREQDEVDREVADPAGHGHALIDQNRVERI